jgi:hypothetical protein
MDTRDKAEEVARKLRETEEHITALKTVLQKTMGTLQLAKLESDVQDELDRGRADPSYLKYVAELEREFAGATDSSFLVQILYREGLQKAKVP